MEKPKKFIGNCNFHVRHLEFLDRFGRGFWGKKEEPKIFLNNYITNMHVPHPEFQDKFGRDLWGKKEEQKRFLDNYITNIPDPVLEDKFGRDLWGKKEEPKRFLDNYITNIPEPVFEDKFGNDLWGKKEEPKRFLDNYITNIPDSVFEDKFGNDLWGKKEESIEKEYEDLEMIDEGSSVTQLNANDIIDTDYQTIQPIEPLPRKKLIFGLIKPGRKKKKESYNNYNPLVHTKYRDDDIIMKIKVKSWDHYEDHLNLMLKRSDNDQINRIILIKIDPSIIKVHSRDDNLALLNKKISDIFSGKISKRFKNVEPLYNAKKIDLILQEGDPEIISALNKTFLDSIDLYCSKRTDIYLFEELQKLENDIEEFKNNGENEDYIQKYTEIAKNFKQKIKVIHKRQPRRKEK